MFFIATRNVNECEGQPAYRIAGTKRKTR